MTYEQIHNLFKQRYNQNNWKQFLGGAFADPQLLATPEILMGIDSNVASQVQKLGYINLDENGFKRQIAVYEVTLAQGIILERNRVGLRNLLRKYWKDMDAAFIAYHRPETPNWRFTYVSESPGFVDKKQVKIETEPKRYTYVLGEGESTRTAAERFTAIAAKGSKATLDDVKDAFSVEKLSKAFFDEYKKHYDIFCDFMVSKPSIRQTIFNGDEKGIRDFNKKLLGRIVFLYFIQKKGWLGVPVNEDWGKGDFNFLTQQFENFRNKDLFYQSFLSPLFFETLNLKRENDIASFLNNQTNPENHSTNNLKIPYLNGGLFEEEDKKHRNLIFPANLFKNLFDFFNQYNFTIYEDDPNDHTVAVDPEMLGHIFENLLEDNKDKGAFYTPKEIVHYMCQESLIEYLTTWFENKGYEIVGFTSLGNQNEPELYPINDNRNGQLLIEVKLEENTKKIDRSLIEKLLKKKLDDDDKKLVTLHSAEFHNALDTVKICDPAIGSGAFPMGLLHEIFTANKLCTPLNTATPKPLTLRL
ncbi:MAG: SAM-dependent DNA methyltransferase [Bacteroidetes bacterium]|nr:SAM-dependent DNA methyltransferase [Bacteroidota bacterium]